MARSHSQVLDWPQGQGVIDNRVRELSPDRCSAPTRAVPVANAEQVASERFSRSLSIPIPIPIPCPPPARIVAR